MRSLVVPAAALLAACGGGDDARTPLVVYSPHGREVLEAFEGEFEAANPGIDLQGLDMGSQEVLDRLRSERANPQADVWWGAPAEMFETAAAEGLLEAFEPTWGAAVREGGYADDAGLWWGQYLTPEVIAYNTTNVTGDAIPHDWDDVLDPRWKGRVLIRDPLASGTMRTIFAMVIERSLRETGDTARGFDWLRRLDANTKEYVLNPTMLYQKLARGEGDVTLWDLPDIEMLKAKGNFPIDYVIPASGTPLVVDGIAIPKGAPHMDAAKAFVEWIGSPAAVTTAARRFHRLPARGDIPADSLPPNLRSALATLKPEPMDAARVQARINDWMRLWDEQVRGRGGR